MQVENFIHKLYASLYYVCMKHFSLHSCILGKVFYILSLLFFFHLYRQNTVVVSANDIVITNVEQTDDGLEVTFYVRGGSGDTSGVISVDVVEEAVRVSITKLYIYNYT